MIDPFSADCPCCGSDKTERKEVDAYQTGPCTVLFVFHNECQECKAEFVEEILVDIMKYDTISADEGEHK